MDKTNQSLVLVWLISKNKSALCFLQGISNMNLSELIFDCKMNQNKTFETFLAYFNKTGSLGTVLSK